MNNARIYLNAPDTGASEIEHLTRAVESGWISTVGKELERFEQELENLVGQKRVLALNTGTSALHLALKLSGMQPGDRVGVSDLTFCASANVVLYEQGIPIFFDSDEESWNLNPALLEEYLSENRLHALILTHLYGMPADVFEIKRICKKSGVVLIEDAAESLGATVSGAVTGAIGDYGIFSFNGNKIITTSGGGALIANSKDYDTGLKWATQSKEEGSLAYHHEEIGYNYRLSNILAALGTAQLAKLPDYLKKKQVIHQYYRDHLPACCFAFQESKYPDMNSNFWLNGLTIRAAIADDLTPTDVIVHLEKHDIESRPFWKPMHLQPLYSQAEKVGGTVSESLFNSGFCLPSGVGMRINELEHVVTVLRELLISRGLLK